MREFQEKLEQLMELAAKQEKNLKIGRAHV